MLVIFSNRYPHFISRSSRFQITDQKTNTELGSFNYHISNLLGLDDWKRDLEPFLLSKSGNNCKIVFSAQLKVSDNSKLILFFQFSMCILEVGALTA